MEANELLTALNARLKSLDAKIGELENKIRLLEDITVDHETRLQELEEAEDDLHETWLGGTD